MDPVRFIGNYSTGKMGFAIAEALAERGAEVSLISGPVNLTSNNKNIKITRVQTAEQMYVACMDVFNNCNGAILTAAVADYRPAEVNDKKIKKEQQAEDDFEIKLVKNKDILAHLGKIKNTNQILGGFSLETHNEENFAKEKLERKNCDFIVLNSLQDKGAGFATDTNKISIFTRKGKSIKFELKSKKMVANDIVDFMISEYFAH